MSLTIDQLRALDALVQTGLDQPETSRRAWFDALTIEPASLKTLLAQALFAGPTVESGTFMGTVPKIERSRREALDLSAGDVVGPYQLETLLGEGGSASVWRALRTDGTMKRAVALKLPYFVGNTGGWAERIERERDVLASLNHPNVATIYDAGIADNGRPWLALELINGERIDRYARAKQLTGDNLIRLFLPVVRAIEHAHARGVIHRDVKPQNILVSDNDRGEAQVKLLDFGIAKLQNEFANQNGDSELTRMHGRPFTPEYASLEQLRGETITTATDIYSLWVVFYELLCGKRPFASKVETSSLRELERQIAHDQPLAPSTKLNVSINQRTLTRLDLDAIALKAIHRDSTKRYQTASAFADDLDRYLAGQTVSARPDSATYRAKHFVRRNKSIVLAANAVTFSLIGGLVIAFWQASEASRQQKLAEIEAARATGALSEANTQRKLAKSETTRAEENLLRANSESLGRAEALEIARGQAARAESANSEAQKLAIEATSQARRSEIAKKIAENEKDKATAVKSFLIDLLNSNKIDRKGGKEARDQTIGSLLREASANLDSSLEEQPEIKQELLAVSSTLLERLGLYSDAIKLIERELILLERSGDTSTPLYADAKYKYQIALAETGARPKATEVAYSELARLQNKKDAASRLAYARMQITLSQIQLDSTQPETALKTAQLADGAIAALKPNGVDHFKSTFALAKVYWRLEQPKEWKRTFARAADLAISLHGQQSIERAEVLFSWAQALRNTNEVKQSLERSLEALSIAEHIFGKDTQQWAEYARITGMSYTDAGNPKQGRELLEKSVALLRASKPTPETSETLYDALLMLCFAYGDLGLFEKQKTSSAELLPLARAMRAKGASYPVLSNALSQFAYSHYESGDYSQSSEAIDELERLLIENGLGDHSQRWRARWLKASIANQTGDIAKAKLIASDIATAHEKRPRRALDAGDRAMLLLASIAVDEKAFDLARTIVQEALLSTQVATTDKPPDDVRWTASHKQILGRIDLAEKRYQSAFENFQPLLGIREKSVDPDSPVLAMIRSLAAEALYGLKRDEEADQLFKLAAEAFGKSTGYASFFSQQFKALSNAGAGTRRSPTN